VITLCTIYSNKGERYHFQEFRHRGQPSGWKEVFNCLYVLLVCCCSLFKSGFVFYVYYQLIVLLLDYLLTGNNVMLWNFIYVLYFMVWYVYYAHWCCFCLSNHRFLYYACVYYNCNECHVSMSCRITFISTCAVKIRILSFFLCVCMLRKKVGLLWM